MNIKYSRKEKILIIFYLIMIFFLGIGMTFSYYLLADSAQKDSTRVYSGTLDISYIQGNQVTTEKLQPIPEPEFDSYKDIYRNRFTVSTSGTLEQTVQIGFDISKNEFSNNSLRYAFYTGQGEKISSGYLNDGFVTFVDNLYFTENESREYVLLIWLEEKPIDQSEQQGCKLYGKIHVNSKQYGY